MNNAKDNSKIVVAALLGALIVQGIHIGKMLLKDEWDLMRYRYIIDQKNETHAELMAKIHELEWKLEQLEES